MEYKKKYIKYKNKYLRLKYNIKGGNLLEHNIQDVGGWSGTCTCPNGQQYKVGDNHNGCRSLACIGGVSSGCSKHDRSGLRKRVTCVNTTNPTNLIEENVPEVGGWSGTCTCPNGQQYKVGDLHNGCRSLACIGGVSSGCNRNDKVVFVEELLVHLNLNHLNLNLLNLLNLNLLNLLNLLNHLNLNLLKIN